MIYAPGKQGQIDLHYVCDYVRIYILCKYAIKSKQTKNLNLKSE